MFKNLVTLVSGASSGIGKVTAEYFARKGARVVLCDLSTSNGAAVAAAIGDNALFVPTDITSENDVQSLLDVTKQKFGKLNVIVNCHSVPSPLTCRAYNFETKQPHQLADFQGVLVANAVGAFNLIRLGVGLIAKNVPDPDGEKGVIINTISKTGSHPLLGQVGNETANGCLSLMSRAIAVEFAPQGIRVVTIAQDNITETNSVTDGSINSNGFAQLAHLIVTTPYINATTITLEGCAQRPT